jgi:L-lactate dehydrogenase complex protein LldG
VGSVVSPALFGQAEFGQLARASSLCGACREACPVDIDIPKLLLRVRAGIQTSQEPRPASPNAPLVLKTGLSFFSLAAASPKRFAFAQRMAGLFGGLFSGKDGMIHLPGLTGWGVSKDFPRPAASTFHTRFAKMTHATPVQITQRSEQDHSHLVETKPPAVLQFEGTARFEQELTALGGHCIKCTKNDLLEQILAILKLKGIDQLITWDAPHLTAELLAGLSKAGITVIHPTAETLDQCGKVPAGLTGAYAGLANTGSLVLLGGQGRPMMASLLPEIHIAILQERDLYESLNQVISRPEIKQASSGVIVTGPSRTSDIEMTLTIGVHGPGELWVICINDA